MPDIGLSMPVRSDIALYRLNIYGYKNGMRCGCWFHVTHAMFVSVLVIHVISETPLFYR